MTDRSTLEDSTARPAPARRLRWSVRRPPVRTAGTAGVAVAGVVAGALVVPAQAAPGAPAAAPLAAAAPAGALPSGSAWPGHPDRLLVRHRVRPGETATSLAVRYHAWTAELVRLNRLGRSATVYVGQVVRVPVVVSAYRRATGRTPGATSAPRSTSRPPGHTSTPRRGWRHADLSRAQVAHVVRSTARRHGVPGSLALAVAWQESGWQQRRVSSTGALGVMQVMPDTGRWMRQYAGRPLRLRDTHDNVLAGVLTLRVLRAETRHDRNAIAAYYQGLGAVRERGLFEDTKVYVRSVRAIQSRIERVGSPL